MNKQLILTGFTSEDQVEMFYKWMVECAGDNLSCWFEDIESASDLSFGKLEKTSIGDGYVLVNPLGS